ncbi:tRNA (N6-isopentenyl adenosine(37)-C2)-methylthiotransferase MiaB [Halanaerobacter jeridensis]|uniref:tRNA-2-methylthio-N(6)-dimethylallyladenosine synthase n=1 Tax=Halanaerobacter jeridensis TaxID=706427 RepID=A0A938XQX6_9FIRM|nr:tRNA (N6-isopentenyl adenosine(37)-C2)-methylthiotransferase MiaB [Halanaerobacter jeridensis]MBM7555946.1 tRNA-2-methylthio-N6-dimethylallyladenosine synthase [Halanaerobacter jeridensis]
MRENYFIRTYGCQMNENDSEKIAGVLENKGYEAVDEIEEADIIILNTCCVRENAELKVFGKLGQLKQLKRENPELLVGICGCMMQEDHVVEEIKEKYAHVDLVFGTHNLHYFSELLEEAKQENSPLVEVWDESKELISDMPVQRSEDHKAKVTIIYGCDNYCTYCIVPYVRGQERSRPAASIVQDIKDLAADGVKEVMLLGQNVNSYGQDLDMEIDFADLLVQINEIKDLDRIRYMTPHPRDFNDKLINTISNLDKVCEQFHLPVQAGSNKILKEMNRGYTREEYIELVNKIRDKNPNAAISTDTIVGFPGETEEDFQKTIELYKEIKFDMAYMFNYSQRSGTPAAEKENQVPEEIKKERLQYLMDLQSEIGAEKNKELIGETVEVLVDGPSKKDPSKLAGRSRTHKIVIFEGEENLTGEIVNVMINEAQSWTLFGELVEKSE